MVTGTALSTQKNSAVSWGDFDGDGDLDLVVGKRLGNSLPNELYRNDLHLGTTPPTFTQITGTPISDLSFNGAYTFAWGDFDQDGKLDLAIGSATANGLMRNLGGGVFEAVTGTAITASSAYTYAIALADVDNDGDLDLATGQMGSADELFVFTHCPSSARLGTSAACLSVPSFARRAFGSDQAFECSANTQGGTIPTECVDCPPGFDRSLGGLACARCDPGFATAGSAVACNACKPGFAAANNGSVFCTVCPGGTYAANASSVVCEESPIGFWSSTGSSQPKPCTVGRYGSTSGRVDDQCTGACDEGHYCTPGSTMKNPPSCSIGYYLEMRFDVTTNATTPVCNKCDPSLMNCSIPGITLTNMPIKPGGWRLGGASARIIRCFSTSGACAGNLGILTPVMDASNASSNVTARRLNGVDPSTIETFGDALCTAGHTGVLCGQCMEGWNGYSDAILCSECEVGNIATSLIPLIVLLVLGVLVLAALSLRGGINLETVMDGGVAAAMEEVAMEKVDAAKEELDAKVNEAEEAAAKGQQSAGCKSLVLRFIGKAQKFGTKFKILVSLWQILQGMGSVFAIPFPPFYESVTGAVGGMIQVPSLVPIDGTS